MTKNEKELVMHLKKNRAFIPYIRNRKAYLKMFNAGCEHTSFFVHTFYAFDWGSTIEGPEYWRELNRKLI